MSLTAEDREHIRNFILKFLSIPALGLAVGGFFVGDTLAQKAQNAMYDRFLSNVQDNADKMAAAKAVAETTLSAMQSTLVEGRQKIDVAVKGANEAADGVRAASQRLRQDTASLARELAGTETFQNAAFTVLTPAAEAMKRTLDELQRNIDSYRNLPYVSSNFYGSRIEFGVSLKASPGTLEIKFNTPFQAPPTVVVSPFWQGSSAEVRSADTITSTSTNGFKLTSGNNAPNYYVSWIAIGKTVP